MKFDSAKFGNADFHFRASIKEISADIFEKNYTLVDIQIRDANDALTRMENAVERGADDPEVVAYIPRLFKFRRELQRIHYIYEAQLVADARKEKEEAAARKEEEKTVELTGYAAKIRQFAK